jgi:hypothetical protein
MGANVKIDYRALNSRQQENYNFQKVAALLADYRFMGSDHAGRLQALI